VGSSGTRSRALRSEDTAAHSHHLPPHRIDMPLHFENLKDKQKRPRKLGALKLEEIFKMFGFN